VLSVVRATLSVAAAGTAVLRAGVAALALPGVTEAVTAAGTTVLGADYAVFAVTRFASTIAATLSAILGTALAILAEQGLAGSVAAAIAAVLGAHCAVFTVSRFADGVAAARATILWTTLAILVEQGLAGAVTAAGATVAGARLAILQGVACSVSARDLQFAPTLVTDHPFGARTAASATPVITALTTIASGEVAASIHALFSAAAVAHGHQITLHVVDYFLCNLPGQIVGQVVWRRLIVHEVSYFDVSYFDVSRFYVGHFGDCHIRTGGIINLIGNLQLVSKGITITQISGVAARFIEQILGRVLVQTGVNSAH